MYSVSAKFIGLSDRQDKYVIGLICLISSRTEMSDVASNTMYTMYTQSQTDISSVLWKDSRNRTECPMNFHKVSRTLCIPSWRNYIVSSHMPKQTGLAGLKLPQKSREKSLLPPVGLGRRRSWQGEVRFSLSQRCVVTCRVNSHYIVFICLLFIYFHPIYIQCCRVVGGLFCPVRTAPF